MALDRQEALGGHLSDAGRGARSDGVAGRSVVAGKEALDAGLIVALGRFLLDDTVGDRLRLDSSQPVATGTATPEAAWTPKEVLQQRVPDLQSDLAQAIQFWAAHYGVSAAEMRQVAWCESTFGQDPNAYNGVSGHAGAYQFEAGTWLGTPPGQRGESAYNDWYAAEGASWMIAQGRRAEWPSC